MSGLFRLAYACSVAVVFLMCVIFGSHALLDEDSSDYYRLVFVIAGLIGVAGILAGTAIFRRQLPMAAGLAMGGIGSIVFGWTEWENGPDEVGDLLAFVVVFAGLVVLLGGGYWFMRESEGEKASESPSTTQSEVGSGDKPDSG